MPEIVNINGQTMTREEAMAFFYEQRGGDFPPPRQPDSVEVLAWNEGEAKGLLTPATPHQYNDGEGKA